MRNSMILAASLIGFLTGCGMPEDPASAASDDPAALTRAAIPGWQPEGKQSVQLIPPPDGNPADAFYSLAPALVVKQGDAGLVLFVTGKPSTAEGGSLAGHASPGIIGAYWFERQGNKWLKRAADRRFAEEGFFGNPGELRRIDLGNGEVALAVENGSCWQGTCGRWLSLYRIGAGHVSRIFDTMLSSDSENASTACSTLLALASGQQKQVSSDDYSTHAGCHRIEGQAKILPTAGGPGQLLIEFSGVTTSGRQVAVDNKPQPDREDDEDAPSEEYLVTVTAVREKETYRFDNGKYQRVSGRNPNPAI